MVVDSIINGILGDIVVKEKKLYNHLESPFVSGFGQAREREIKLSEGKARVARQRAEGEGKWPTDPRKRLEEVSRGIEKISCPKKRPTLKNTTIDIPVKSGPIGHCESDSISEVEGAVKWSNFFSSLKVI